MAMDGQFGVKKMKNLFIITRKGDINKVVTQAPFGWDSFKNPINAIIETQNGYIKTCVVQESINGLTDHLQLVPVSLIKSNPNVFNIKLEQRK